MDKEAAKGGWGALAAKAKKKVSGVANRAAPNAMAARGSGAGVGPIKTDATAGWNKLKGSKAGQHVAANKGKYGIAGGLAGGAVIGAGGDTSGARAEGLAEGKGLGYKQGAKDNYNMGVTDGAGSNGGIMAQIIQKLRTLFGMQNGATGASKLQSADRSNIINKGLTSWNNSQEKR